MPAAWSPFCQRLPACGIRNPQASSEPQAEQQRKLEIQMSVPPMKRCQWKAMSQTPLIPPSGGARVKAEGHKSQSQVTQGMCVPPGKDILREPESFEDRDCTKPANIHRWGFSGFFLTLEDAAKQTKGHKTLRRLRKQSSSGRIFFLAWWRVETTGTFPS